MVLTKISEQSSSVYNGSIFSNGLRSLAMNRFSSMRLEDNDFSVGEGFIFSDFYEEKVGGYGVFLGCLTEEGQQARIYPSQLLSCKAGCLNIDSIGVDNKVVVSGTLNGIDWHLNRTERDKALVIIREIKAGDVIKCVDVKTIFVPPYDRVAKALNWNATPNEWRPKRIYSWEVIKDGGKTHEPEPAPAPKTTSKRNQKK